MAKYNYKKHVQEIAKHFSIDLPDPAAADSMNMFIDNVDYSHDDGVYIRPFKRNSLIKFSGRTFEFYCSKESREPVDMVCVFLHQAFGFPARPDHIDGRPIIKYMGDFDAKLLQKTPVEKPAREQPAQDQEPPQVPPVENTPEPAKEPDDGEDKKDTFQNAAQPPENDLENKPAENAANEDVPQEPVEVFSIKKTPEPKIEPNDIEDKKGAFQNAAQPPENDLEKRAQVWRKRGFKDVDIRDESVWVPIKDKIAIEDRGNELKLHGGHDLKAIFCMVAHAKEQWNGKCTAQGDYAFRMLVWHECRAQGVVLNDFTPKIKDKIRTAANDLKQVLHYGHAQKFSYS